MLGNHVPFGRTAAGGILKALGNPGVYWQVAACVLACTIAVLVWCGGPLASRAIKAVNEPVVRGTGASVPLPSVWLTVWKQCASALPAPATATNELGGGGWVIPFVTLLFGYYINLVPYELITRSKFVYHYIPALLVGMQFTVFVCDIALRWTATAGRPMLRAVVVACVAAVFVIVAWGFYYWGLPYAYGFPLSHDQHQARRWISKW
jgi:dolichyl-phosphate-mannose--protein O-mannosyl transferase